MSEFRKLFRAKRILAMILAVAMTVTSIPATANAASLQPQTEAEQAAEETPAADGGQSSDSQAVPSDIAEGQDGDASESQGSGEDSGAEDPSEAEGGSETEGNTAVGDNTDAGENTDAEDNTNAGDSADVENGSGEDAADGAGTSGTGNGSGTETDPALEGEETVDPTVAEKEYTFVFSDDFAEYTSAQYRQGEALFATDADAADAGMTVNTPVLERIRLQNIEDEGDSYNLSYNSDADIVKALTYSWKQDGKELEIGKSPRECGDYQLVIKLAAKAGEYKAAETTIDFQITKAKVDITFGVSDVDPGDLVSDVVLNYAEAIASDGKYFTYEIDGETTENEVAFALVVKEAATNNVLKSDARLVKNVEYVVNAAPTFTGKNADNYTKNYEFNQPDEQSIVVNDLIKTKVRLTLNVKYDNAQYKKESAVSAKDPEQQIEKITIKSYDGKAVAGTEPQIDKVEVGVSGVDQEGKETFDAIQGAATKTTWHSAAYESWNEGKDAYCNLTVGGELESVPEDAGIYVYRVSYEGNEEQYGASNADVVVEIEAVDLIMQPKFDTTPKSFYAGQTAADVLAEVGYELPYADKDGRFTISEEKKTSFWGTSYVDAAKTQPYEPVFEVVKTTTVTENGTQTTKTAVLGADEQLVYDEKGAITYAVRFTGDKAVYYADGREHIRKGINDPADSTTSNYTVRVDQDTLEQHTVSFDVKNMNAEIDTNAIIDGFTTNADFHNAAVKTYDGARLFPNRADYKKAQLKSNGMAVSGVSNTDLTYRWYSSSYRTVMDTKVLNDEGVFEETENFGNSFNIRNDLISPTAAGIYKLVISYQDKEGKYFAKPAEVYFVIEQQKLQVKLSDKEYSEFSGVTVGQFLSDAQIEYNIVPELAKPVAGDAWQEYGYSTGSYPYYYDVEWQVEEKQRDADGNALKDEGGNDIYSPLQYYESFVYDEKNFADSYRLSVAEFTCYNSNYTVEKTTIRDGEKDPDNPDAAAPQYKVTENLSVTDANTAKIIVNQMGTTAIHIDMDQTIKKEKDYNGVSIYDVLGEDLAKIKVVKDNEDGTTAEVKDVNLTYTVTDIEAEMSIALDELSEEEFDFWAKYDMFINGGTYVVTAQFKGDATYAPMEEQEIARVTVNAIPLTITPPTLEDTVVAGTRVYEVKNKADNAFGTDYIEGYLSRDAAYFNRSELYYTENGQIRFYGYGYAAWFYDYGDGDYGYAVPQFGVLDQHRDEVLEWDGVLKGEGADRYKLIIESSGELTGRCARNYYTEYDADTPIKMVRGNASLRAVGYSNIADVDTTDSVSGMTHTLKVLDGIKYISFNDEEGNFVAVEIIAPSEYRDDSEIWERAVYGAALRKAGGTIVRDPHYVDDDKDGYAITAVFDASKGGTEFGIRWEEDYVETFKLAFSEDDCLGNLGDAVSPKTIAFNAPNKNMVVGETQNLDVKITKVQKDDVICLGYEVTNGAEYLCVNEYGKATALKAGGSATVTVYPMHLVDGVKVPLEGNDVKKASVTIKIKDVTAPKISKVTPVDYQVNVQYPYVKDVDYNYGYRREIYVLEGKNLSEKDFKDKLGEVSNEQWQGIFAAAPVFLTNSEEYSRRVYDSKKHDYINTVSYTISGLKPNTDYTVYVRNVSAVRTLADGCLVTESAAGSVKGFTTTKSQVKDLEVTLKDRTETDKEGEIGKSNLEWIEYDDVKLSEGSVQLQVKGYFESWAKNPAAEPVDEEGGFDIDSSQPFALALSKDDKQYYVDPKINYYFWAYADGEGYYDAYTGQAVEPGEYYRSAVSSIASIDKKGKLTLKQPGWVEIVAVDTTTGVWSNQVNIRISAEADAIKGKTTTLQVGQSMRLENLIEYKEGNKVLDQAWYSTSGRVDRNGLKAQIEESGYFELSDGGYVTAVKGRGNIRVILTDKVLNESVQVTIKSVDLAPVKNLKAVDVIDNRFTVQFERNPFAQAYRINVKNARGNLIRSIYAEDYKVGNYYRGYYDDEGEYVGTIYDNDSDWDDDWQEGDWHCYYDRKTGKTYGEYTVKGLTQQSKYTVTVQALYKDVSSKAVPKGVTTTKLPAAEYDLAKDETGGINIYVWNYDGHSIDRHPFVSGNDYTLVAEPENWGAKYATTDTLTWSSSNKKVATVKPNAGSYSALLKAVRNGETTIEVKSKITKKVIARYDITVRNVGDAYNSNTYYGDNEDLRGDGTTNIPACTEFTLGSPGVVDLGSGQTKWFAFTAPEKGTYNFYRVLNGSRSTGGFSVYDAVVDGSYKGYSVAMDEGETVYVQAYAAGSYTINVEKQKSAGISDRTPLELGSVTMQVTNGQYFVFTAVSEGLYRFSGTTFRVEDTEGNQKTQGSPAQCWLEDGETVYLCAPYVSGQCTVTVEKLPVQSLTADQTAAEVVTDAYGKAWFSFTAPKAAEYEFVVSGIGWNKYINLYNCTDITNAIAGEYDYTDESVSLSYMLGSGTTVLIDAGSSGNKLEVKTKAAVETVTAGEDKNITLAQTNQYFEFAASADGFYRFTSAGANGVSAALYKDLTGEAVDTSDNYNGDAALSCYLKSGQHAYFVARSNNGDVQADVKIKVESVTPELIGETEVNSEVGAYSDKWFSYTAGENEKYTFTLTSDVSCSASLYTLGALGADRPVPVKELYVAGKKHFDYEMTANQTVYWRVKNDNYNSANVTVKAAKYAIPALGEGSEDFDIEAYTAQILTFTAAEAGKYTFRFRSNSYSGFNGYLYDDASLNNQVGSVWIYAGYEQTYECNMEAGKTVYWKLDNTTGADVTVTVGVEQFKILPMDEGENIFPVNGSSSKYYSFTAPEAGDYIFAFKNDNGNSCRAYKYSDMYFDSYNDSFWFYSSYQKQTYTLTALETVYWKIEDNSGYDTVVTALVKRDVPAEITAGGVSAEVASDFEQWFSYTSDADEDARYRFTFTVDRDEDVSGQSALARDTSYNCYAYFYRDRNEGGEGGWDIENSASTLEEYVKAGETVYWKIKNQGGTAANVTVKAEKAPMTAVEEGKGASAVIYAGTTQLFSISLPNNDTEYVITAMSMDAPCEAYLYSDLSLSYDKQVDDSCYIYAGDSNSKNWYVSSAEAGNILYMKVRNYSADADTKFKVFVKERTEQPITENSSAVTIAPGAEQWFSYTSAADMRYMFMLASDAEACDWNRYEGDDLSYSKESYTERTNEISMDIYIPQGVTVYWKVKNRSVSNSTSVTVTVKTVDIQEIGPGEEAEVSISPAAMQLFSISLPESAAEYIITLITTDASCYAELYTDISMSDSSIMSESIYSGSSCNWTVAATEGGKACLKVTNNRYNSNETQLKISVKKRTEEPVTEDSSAVTVAPGAEQWFSYTAAADMRYVFTLASDSESCGWYLYKDEETSSEQGSLSTTESVIKDIYVAKDGTIRWKVKNNSLSNSTSVTVTAKAIDIQEINAGEEAQPVTIVAGSTQWFSYPVTEDGRHEFTFSSTSYCSVTPYSELSAEPGYNDRISIYGGSSTVKDYYVSGKMYFKVENTGNSDAQLTVKAEQYTVTDLDAVNGSPFDTRASWFRFTAAEAGLYRFNNQEGSSSSNRTLALYRELGDTRAVKEVRYDYIIEYYMSAGESVYLKVYSSSSSNVTGTLKAERLAVADLNVGSDTAVSLTDQSGYAKFVAAGAGIYSFRLAGSEAETTNSGYLYLYADLNDDNAIQQLSYSSSDSSTDGLVYPMMAGDAVYLKVVNDTAVSELQITAAQEQVMEEIAVSQEQPMSLKQNEEKWIYFQTSEEQYQYYMNASWDGEAELEIQYPGWSYYNKPYSSTTWKDNMQSDRRYRTFTDMTLYTYNKESLFCVCITPDRDVDITFSVATATQN